MISGLALILMDIWELDPGPAYAAAWALLIGTAGALYLIADWIF